MSEVKATLETFKIIRDSDFAISVNSMMDKTGFDKRRVQRQAKLLTELGLVSRIGENPERGYVYKVTPSSAG
ncbi:hypothetical protein FQV37_2240 [Psychrobacter nivimaris]|uniref:Uncharacterized protein n=1 Tax=Psychrobacter nivimaris TaxID=281738 RepID=A0A6N7BUQ2_9GAMM|nr:hypothetical protein [Psychrobacter nivimaris]KAF0567384.1 hypothetical protein FQV37_2240 [Psychrobacter nivimaris]|tara:strand:- start:1417 stop:1632 length:216 start_codon:yes stop_codon:yes gene_type:complete